MIIHGGRFSDEYSKKMNLDISVMTPFFTGPFKQCLVGKADLKEELEKVLGLWKWNGTVDELMQYWFSIGDKIYDDVYESIITLKNQGLVVCLATNQEKYRNEYLNKKLSYDSVFDHVFCSAELGYPKHSNEGLDTIFNILQEKYGIDTKEEIMYWDDRKENVENLNKMEFNGQQYTDFISFKTAMLSQGYHA